MEVLSVLKQIVGQVLKIKTNYQLLYRKLNVWIIQFVISSYKVNQNITIEYYVFIYMYFIYFSVKILIVYTTVKSHNLNVSKIKKKVLNNLYILIYNN